MKKYLAVALSVMIASAGVPTFADENLEKNSQEIEVYEESTTDFLTAMISEGVEIYLELDRENDPAAEVLSEKLKEAFALVINNEPSENVMRDVATEIGSIIEEHEEAVEREAIEKEEELLKAYVDLGNKLKDEDLTDEDKKEILEQMEELEEEWYALQEEFDEDEFEEDEFDEDEFDEDEFDEDEFDEDEFDEDEFDEDEFDEDEFDEDMYANIDELLEELESIKAELLEKHNIEIDFEVFEDEEEWEDHDEEFEDEEEWEDYNDEDFEDEEEWEDYDDEEFEDEEEWEDYDDEDFEDEEDFEYYDDEDFEDEEDFEDYDDEDFEDEDDE